MAENRILNNNLQVKGVSQMWSGGGSHYYYFERNNELNVYTAAGDSSTMYLNFRGGDINFANTKAIIKSDTGNFGINVTAPSYKLDVGGDIRANQGKIVIKRGTGLTHAEWEDDSGANGRAQLILDSHYSDLIIASRNANSNKHGSTLTFATQSTSTNDVAKWVIGQGQYQEGANHLAFAYGVNQTNPHSILGTDNAYADFVIMDGGKVVIGGTVEKNAYNSTPSTRLMFGGANADAESNYYIGTNMEDYGGNHTKLDLRWHTGIRMGAYPTYGGIRFYDSEDLGTVIMSIGETDANVRIKNTLLIGGTAYIAPVGESMDLRKVNSISFAPNNGWNDPTYHGIMSTSSAGTASDNISINSYNDITLRLDANSNNDASYLRITNNTTGNASVGSWFGYNGSKWVNRLRGNVGIDAEPRTDSYRLAMGGSVHMGNSNIHYTNEVHFNSGTRFRNDGNNYLNFRSDSTTSGGITLYDGGDNLKGYGMYWDGSGNGVLNSNGSWGLRLSPGNGTASLYHAGSEKLITQSYGTRTYGDHRVDSNLYLEHQYGSSIVGAYSSTRYQGIYAMGNAYKLSLDGTSPGTLYGLAWTHSNVGGQSVSGLGHQMLVMSAGTTRTAIGDGIWTPYDIRGARFVDYNDTNYYLDPASSSKIRRLDIIASGSGWNDGLNLYSSDGSNEWNLLVDNGNADNLRFAYNNAERVKFEAGGNIRLYGNTFVQGALTVNKAGTDSYIHFPAQNNDPGYIRHYESNNTARMYFSVSDDSGTTDYFGFGYSGNQDRFRIYSNGQWESQGSGSIFGDLTTSGNIYTTDGTLTVNGGTNSTLMNVSSNNGAAFSVSDTAVTSLKELTARRLSNNSNRNVFTAYGGEGDLLFSISDLVDNSSLFSVNTKSGIPALEVLDDSAVKIGPFTAPVEVTSTGELKVDGGTDLGTAVTGASVSNDTITFTRANGGTFSVTTSDANTNTWRPVDDTPQDGETGRSISSNWAFDNVKTAVPANAVFTDTNTQLTDAQVRSKFSAGTNVAISSTGVISATDTNTWRPVDDTPQDGETTRSISSNWAFDNVKTAVPANAVFTDTDTNTWRPLGTGSTDAAAGNHTHGIGGVTDAYRWWNNFGDNHDTRTGFDAPGSALTTGFGWRYVQGNSNGPGTDATPNQFYGLTVGLGNDYNFNNYAMQLVIPRNTATPYISVRFEEGQSLGAWQKISAGYADSAGNADTVDSLHASSFFRADTGNSADARIAAGDGRGLRFWDSDSYKIYMSDVNNGTWGGRVGGETTSDYNMYFKMNGGTNRGFIFRNGTNNVANIDASGNGRFEGDVVAYSASDKRLKDNLTPIENACEKVRKLTGYEFDWNDNQDVYKGHDIGVVAQEVEEVFPEIVKTRDSGYKAVDYEKLVAVLIEANKELQNRVKTLEDKIDGLTE